MVDITIVISVMKGGDITIVISVMKGGGHNFCYFCNEK